MGIHAVINVGLDDLIWVDRLQCGLRDAVFGLQGNMDLRCFREGAFTFKNHIKEVPAGELGFADVSVIQVGGDAVVDRFARHLFPVGVEIIEVAVEIVVRPCVEDGARDAPD